MAFDDEIGQVLADINALSNKQQTVSLAKQAESLLKFFRQKYYDTYGNVPMIGNVHATRNTLKNLIKVCGNLDKTKKVIGNMFTDRWATAVNALRIKEKPSIQLFNFSYSNNLIEILSSDIATKPNHKSQFNSKEIDI